MSMLFSPLTLRGLTIRNRIFMSPMCQYSATDGFPADWHLVHLGSRAAGGAGLVMMEATAVTPAGRISPGDLGIWSGDHALAYRRITGFLRAQGAVPAIQLAHAGRKASADAPWRGGAPLPESEGGWEPLAPSALPFSGDSQVPHALDADGIEAIVDAFTQAAQYALDAGFQVAEIHMAHGYLLHSFLSPLANRRTDKFGGAFENRTRLPLEVARRVREIWPDDLPLFVRISATDWAVDGWDLVQSVRLSRLLKETGIDLIDCSSAGLLPTAPPDVGPGFQTPFAEAIRHEVDIATSAVGLITEPMQAEHILRTEQADAVALGRELLRDPYWPLHAAKVLGEDIDWPVQYQRAKR
ncbi:MAG: NADH:flavin oxidoreductase/NADH oxidase [Gammaproteobacteria bacterium]